MDGFLDLTQLIKASPIVDWSSLDSYIRESSTYGGKTWSFPWTFDLGTIAAHAAATWLTDMVSSSSFTPGRQTRSSSARTFWTGTGSHRPPRGVTCWSWRKGSTAPTRRRAMGRATCTGRASFGRTPHASSNPSQLHVGTTEGRRGGGKGLTHTRHNNDRRSVRHCGTDAAGRRHRVGDHLCAGRDRVIPRLGGNDQRVRDLPVGADDAVSCRGQVD